MRGKVGTGVELHRFEMNDLWGQTVVRETTPCSVGPEQPSWH